MPQVTATQLKAAIDKTRAIAEALRELKTVPSGVFYAQIMNHVTFSEYEKIIGILKNTKLIEETDAHMLIWKGPELQPAQRQINPDPDRQKLH